MAAAKQDTRPAARSQAVPARQTPPIRFAAEDARSAAGDATRKAVSNARSTAGDASRKAASLVKKSKSAVKQRAKSRPRTWKGLFWSLFVRIALFYTVIAAIFNCSSKPFSFDWSTKDDRAVCRALAQSKLHLQPIIAPYYAQLQEKAEPYVKVVRPYAKTVWRHSKPVVRKANKAGYAVYKKHVLPVQRRSINKAKAFAEPHVKVVNEKYGEFVQPHIDTAHKALRPYRDIYWRDVHPVVEKSYSASAHTLSTSSAFYVQSVHPQVVSLSKQLYRFWTNHVSPALARAYYLYVRPQVDKLMGKIFTGKAYQMSTEAVREAKEGVRKASGDASAAASQSASSASSRATQAATGQAPKGTEQAAVKEAGGSAEEHAAKVNAEGDVLREKLEMWEDGMTELIRKEYKLWTERVAEMRNRKVADLPNRFKSLTESFVDEEAAVALSRLDRGFKKLSPQRDSRPLEARLEDAQQLIAKEGGKLRSESSALRKQLAQIVSDAEKDEVEAVGSSADAVDRYADAAIASFKKMLKAVVHPENKEEWDGWDSGMKVRAAMYREELLEVQRDAKQVKAGLGADLSTEPHLGSEIAGLKDQVSSLYESALDEISKYTDSAVAELRGEGARLPVVDVADNIATYASELSNEVTKSLRDAVSAARKKLGLESEDVDLAQSASTASSAAAQKATGAYSTIASAASAASSQAGSYAQQAYDAAADNAESGSSFIGEAVASATDGASDAFNAATTSVEQGFDAVTNAAASATAGATDVFEVATTSVSENLVAASDDATDAFNAATTSISENLRAAAQTGSDAFEAATTSVAENLNAASDTASNVFEAATTSVSENLQAAAATATDGVNAATTSVSENMRAATDSASSLFEAATDTIGDLGSSASSAAANAAATAGDAASSGISVASSAAASVASGASHVVGETVETASAAAEAAAEAAKQGLRKASEEHGSSHDEL